MTDTPQELPDAYVPEELRDGIVACLGDDAAALRGENPEDEMADNMDQAADLIEALRKELAAAQAAHAVGVPQGQDIATAPKDETSASASVFGLMRRAEPVNAELLPDDSRLEDLARGAFEEAMAFGVGLEAFHKLARSVRAEAALKEKKQ